MTRIEPEAGAAPAVRAVGEPAEPGGCYPIGRLLRRPVINNDGEEIGQIADLMISGDRLAYAVLSVGGFLGVGAREVLTPFDALIMDDDEVILPTATEEALLTMAVYDPERAAQTRTPMRRARKGVKDAGQIVSSAAGEPTAGVVADVADGDR